MAVFMFSGQTDGSYAAIDWRRTKMHSGHNCIAVLLAVLVYM
jgi:hypothetical protein